MAIRETMVLASFTGDALALGVHWIYDPQKISLYFQGDLIAPGPGTYHATKKKGEFTHYGDQTLVLLESLAACGGFDLDDFFARWQRLLQRYPGYIDQATRATLKNIKADQGPTTCGSNSNELSAAGRIAPLVYALADDQEALVAAAQAQARMTHTDRDTVAAAGFFARVTAAVLAGDTPAAALAAVASAHFSGSTLARLVDEGISSSGQDSIPTLRRFGQNCHTPDALPGVVHLIAKYETNLEQALSTNVLAGGDSAARGLLTGMVLGAAPAAGPLPQRWTDNLVQAARIRELLARL